jgi:hypothetical protein
MEDDQTCWVEATLVSIEGDLDRAPVVDSPPTPTPVPTTAPRPTQPAGFNGVALRDDMVHLNWVLEQLGGLLDRLYRGEAQSCEEFLDYYWQVVSPKTYPAVPVAWQGVYNEYLWAAAHTAEKNYSVFVLCSQGGGMLSDLDYSVARMGINDSMARLIPAIQTANALLGQ